MESPTFRNSHASIVIDLLCLPYMQLKTELQLNIDRAQNKYRVKVEFLHRWGNANLGFSKKKDSEEGNSRLLSDYYSTYKMDFSGQLSF